MSTGDLSIWRIWADTGGTFTDCIATSPSGDRHRVKVLSSGVIRARVAHADGVNAVLDGLGPISHSLLVGFGVRPAGERDFVTEVVSADTDSLVTRVPLSVGTLIELGTGEPAPIIAARIATGTPGSRALPPAALRLATTRCTNALLTRSVDRTALFVTEGFRDLLTIGDQRRPEIFALELRRPDPWHEEVVEVPGRMDAAGRELQPISLPSLRERAESVFARGIRSAAVALVHAWSNPDHELEVARVLREIGFERITVSSSVARRVRLLPRAQTTVVDACLSGVTDTYLAEIRSAVSAASDASIEVMTSAGGLVDADRFTPKQSLLSGPAGGVAGALASGLASGFDSVIAFDMGGTSTDVSRIDRGEFEYAFTHQVAGAEVMSPALAIESVAAGGGSICGVVHGALAVGPSSAGATPGPACYGAGGPLTITDVNMLLGRIDPSRFGIPVDERAARSAFDALLTESGSDAPADGVLEGLLEIANETMAEAIRGISVRKGYDPAEYALVAFGGAGPQHACAIATILGMNEIVVPPDASLLSATGLGRASAERVLEQELMAPLSEHIHGFDKIAGAMRAEARRQLNMNPEDPDSVRTIVSLRFAGQDHSVEIDWAGEADRLRAGFEDRCRAIYGHVPEGREIEVESIRVVVRRLGSLSQDIDAPAGREDAGPTGEVRARFSGEWRSTPVYDRDALGGSQRIAGPALIQEASSCSVVEPGWEASVDSSGAIRMNRVRREPGARVERPIAVADELISGRLMAIGHEMGEMLRRTSVSVNVKDRLDFSCAVLDHHGSLIGSAPHIPVHLGALGECVRLVRSTIDLAEGDIVVTNHPRFGGSHLPDITAIAPVYSSGQLVAHVACRAHHAEIGGAAPGSMPPGATVLAEEGVVLEPMKLFDAGTPRWSAMRELLEAGPHPTRAIGDNLADLAGAVAALRRGTEQISALCTDQGTPNVHRAMGALSVRAEKAVRDALLGVSIDGSAEERLDDAEASDSWIRVRARSDRDTLTIDLSGTSPVHPGNLNAPFSVTRSAIMYCVRLLLGETGEGVPLNEGLLAPVRIVAPECLLNPGFAGPANALPAIAAGNVEVSQRLVGAVLRAMGVMACGQSTMNNLLFGNERFGFYETICGGSGAGPGFSGTGAIHTHMTNTAITDIEIIERRYPVRVHRFGVRAGSGGRGAFDGGDGAVREIEFLESVDLSVITQNRNQGASGCGGGRPGQPGVQTLIRADGSRVELGPIDGLRAHPGDRLVILTPGGGGWGPAPA